MSICLGGENYGFTQMLSPFTLETPGPLSAPQLVMTPDESQWMLENKSVTLFWRYKPYRAHITDRQGGVIEWSFTDYLAPEKDSRLGDVDAMVRKEVLAFVKRELQKSKSKKSMS